MIFTLLSAFCRLLQDDLIVQKCFVRYCFAMDHIQQHLTGSPSQLCDIELQRGYGNRIIIQNAAVMTGCTFIWSGMRTPMRASFLTTSSQM